MIPDPLHPAIVHFPIVLVALLPVAALLALAAIRRGAARRSAWGAVVALSVALLAATWVAVRTGEAQEEVVEAVVGEGAIHDHEERAEVFLVATFLAVLVFASGLAPGRLGTTGRFAGLVAGITLLALGFAVGESGGALVYEHGAAQAYLPAGSGGAPADAAHSEGGDDDERERSDGEHRPRRR